MGDIRKNLLRLDNASATSSTAIIAAPGDGKQIVLVDVLTSAATTFKQTDGSGAVIAHFPAGSTHLRAGIPCGFNKAVHTTATANVTVTYYVEDNNAI